MIIHAIGYGSKHEVRWFYTTDEISRDELLRRFSCLMEVRRFHHDGRMEVLKRHSISPNWRSPSAWRDVSVEIGGEDGDLIMFHTDHLRILEKYGLMDPELRVLRPDNYVFMGKNFTFPFYGFVENISLSDDVLWSIIEMSDEIERNESNDC